ncbi:hypothetical protein BAU15_07765 [Enterococcus sp. JM4C]|uniref:ABC transporter permease n=1 Tax=Candidatus Enterococcus huntleyi TaxID=1857217 RepID=UPI00137B746D|nr:ABC transporter permease [Enterococcus sp. JM4C]KAF1297599.1 hypothetical protein BAU15_07765 [Enterococcus sp. JM4C]
MNFKTLIFRNLTRNTRSYGAYFFSSLFSVFVFFIFSLLNFHPQISKNIQASSDRISYFAGMGLKASQIVIVLLSFIFLWYTFSVFLHSRKRDFSVYLTLGMSTKDLRKLIFFENLALGTVATTVGVLLGVLLSKVILLVSQNILELKAGLKFYWPWQAMVLSFGIFVLIFFLISLFSLFRIQTEELSSMAKEDDKGQPEPKSNGFLAILSFAFLGLGYLSIWLFATDTQSSPYLFFLLLSCVLCTIIGTFLFFRQGSIMLLKLLKKSRLFYRGTNMLTISELIFRMKDNAMMYSLIAVVSSVAFVGIGVTAVLGSSEFGDTQGNTAAYVYSGRIDSPMTDVQKDNFSFIREKLKETGEPVFEETVSYQYSPYLTVPGQSYSNSYPAISLSSYKKLAKEFDLPDLSMKDNQLFMFTNSNSALIEAKNATVAQRTSLYNMKLGDEESQLEVVQLPFSLNLSVLQLSVVSDSLYDRFTENNLAESGQEERSIENHVGIFHIKDWMDYPEIDQEIMTEMNKREEDAYTQIQDSYDETNQEQSEDTNATTDEEQPVGEMPDYFHVDSLYTTWQNARQANGLILMIGILLGSVFFSFSASILYFRLFGDLDRDGRYHRSLNILGVSEKDRHKIVRNEMLLMYFPPVLIAVAHFAMALFALTMLLGRDAGFVWIIYFKIIGIYFVCLFIFYLISKFRYLKHLDKLAEGGN